MLLTIGGLACSGKSTLAKGLSKNLNIKHISAGQIMREMAKERGETLLELSRFAETHPEIDRDIDKRQKEEATGNCVVDGRLSAVFLNADLKVFLEAPQDVRIRRLMQRDKKSFEDAKTALLTREGSEKKRYNELYNVDLDDLGIYDLVLSSDKYSIEGTLNVVVSAVKNLLV